MLGARAVDRCKVSPLPLRLDERKIVDSAACGERNRQTDRHWRPCFLFFFSPSAYLLLIFAAKGTDSICKGLVGTVREKKPIFCFGASR